VGEITLQTLNLQPQVEVMKHLVEAERWARNDDN
jgi:hypothetical protein